MPANTPVRKAIADFKRLLKTSGAEALAVLKKAEAAGKKNGDKALVSYCTQERKKLKERYSLLNSQVTQLQTSFRSELKKSAATHQKIIKELEALREAAASDNILLEYKKKDLQQKAHELENAYDELSDRNKALLTQKQLIDKQSQELRIAHSEILEKNRELEAKTESLLDQADYLHEANETITSMHKQLEQQQQEILLKNEELLNLNNEKNNLIGIVAHDLKSPLNQIKGLVSIIKATNSALDAETANCLQMIENSANRLSGMIAKILDIEAIESKKLNLVLEPIDFSSLVTAVASRYGKDAVNKELNLITSIQPGMKVLADRSYTDQVIENLLSNAIKFSPSRRSVFVNLSSAEGKALCEIKDEGPGLSDDDKKKLFSKYQKLSAKPTGDESSTGLGLSIVKKFVEAMRGEIWCESEYGKGASFFVKFNCPTD